MSPEAARAAVDAVFGLFASGGSADYIGEPVSQEQHALQAAEAARCCGASDEVVLAALLHDIGHLFGQSEGAERMITGDVILGVANHERVGAQFLRAQGFPERVACLVENHVQAKRYLTFKNKAYYDKLSSASRGTLAHQGGPMTAEEALLFEDSPDFQTILRMRTWDEAAKRPDAQTTPLGFYKDLCLSVLLRN
ncbi:2-amino-1-hydroxyethylphosphonate dioxygenase (glycine-forming)-like [Pollicipes pollicipes]|uniref:2-amino-1-hydroxyethylphosphonate dioxygenase (glycine-forming)-like n=1 Tax=Pollicipes pollicipes TaxID=41117 RepID=UPI001885125E|nr:2-amino-1-hydroxyethylphosphonate dioxygenase (glycine-forming)-like [Pollicipes pollicipes]